MAEETPTQNNIDITLREALKVQDGQSIINVINSSYENAQKDSRNCPFNDHHHGCIIHDLFYRNDQGKRITYLLGESCGRLNENYECSYNPNAVKR